MLQIDDYYSLDVLIITFKQFDTSNFTYSVSSPR